MAKFLKIFIIILFIFLLLPANFTKATILTDFKNQEASGGYVYPQEFDNLAMDLMIPSGINGEDTLRAITLENTGSARNLSDIEKLKLWSDAGSVGFQGMAVDKELGTFTFNGLNNSWYLNNLNETVIAEGLRIFVSVDVSKNATAYRTIQMKISLLSDKNSNGIFDLGDSGIFMESKNNGPTDKEIVNSYSQEIRKFVTDSLAPKTVIIDPKDGATLTAGTSYTIKGVTKDQGGSTPQWVKIGINPSASSGQAPSASSGQAPSDSSGQVVWYEVDSTSSNYGTWEYQWQDITEGDYILKTKSADWLNNTETDGDSITVEVNFPESVIEGCIDSNALNYNPEATTDDGFCEYPPVDEEDEEEEEKPISEMTEQELKAKIKEVQQMIIELLNRLIILMQSQISQL